MVQTAPFSQRWRFALHKKLPLLAAITSVRGLSSDHHYKNIFLQHSLASPPQQNPNDLSLLTLRERIRQGYPTVGVVSGLVTDTEHVEILGLLGGFDFLWADAEHSYAGPQDIAKLILAAERRGMPTWVRIGYGYQTSQAIIGHCQKYLVAGAQGILLPQCERAEDVEQVVAAVKFPPLGKRGLAGERWNAWGLGSSVQASLGERVQEANRNSLVGVLVESRKGLAALPEICRVPELDMVFVAPTDLSADLGLPGQIRHPEVVKRIEEAGKIIKAHGIAAGMLALTTQDHHYWRERGFQVICGVAHSMFIDGATSLKNGMVSFELTQNMIHMARAANSIFTAGGDAEECDWSPVQKYFRSLQYYSGLSYTPFDPCDLLKELEKSGKIENDALDPLLPVLKTLTETTGKHFSSVRYEDFQEAMMKSMGVK